MSDVLSLETDAGITDVAATYTEAARRKAVLRILVPHLRLRGRFLAGATLAYVLLVSVAYGAVVVAHARISPIPTLIHLYADMLGAPLSVRCEPAVADHDDLCIEKSDSDVLEQIWLVTVRGRVQEVSLFPGAMSMRLGDLINLWGPPTTRVAGSTILFSWRNGTITARGPYFALPASYHTPIELVQLFGAGLPHHPRGPQVVMD
jgi:hypothetical protein